MKRFIEGEDRQQVTLLPECIDDYIGEDNPVRVVDAFVEELDLYTKMTFSRHSSRQRASALKPYVDGSAAKPTQSFRRQPCVRRVPY